MNQYKQNSGSQGFTLIELMLAMTFVSLLLLAIAMTTIQISNIYTKGITFQSVNQAGRAVGESLRRDIAASGPFNIDNPTNASDPSRRYVPRFVSGQEVGGRLCIGDVSYVWNYGKYLTTAGANVYASPDTATPIRFIRVIDSGGQLCASPSTQINKANATELLTGKGSKDNLDLDLQTFTISSTTAATDAASGQKMYSISYTIGTNDQQALMASSVTGDLQCVPPGATPTGSQQADWEYCAVNVFDIVVRASSQS